MFRRLFSRPLLPRPWLWGATPRRRRSLSRRLFS
jgi:hypothetical protein